LDGDVGVAERYRHADPVGLSGSEGCQQDEVGWRLPSLDVEGHQQDRARGKGQHDQPRVFANRALDGRSEETHARDQGGHQELDRQEAVNLAEEPHPDVPRCSGNSAVLVPASLDESNPSASVRSGAAVAISLVVAVEKSSVFFCFFFSFFENKKRKKKKRLSASENRPKN
jgi:hypothetical protein